MFITIYVTFDERWQQSFAVGQTSCGWL